MILSALCPGPYFCIPRGLSTLYRCSLTPKATGPDGISPELVKEFAYELSSPLFNRYFKLFLQRRSGAQAVETSHCCSHTQKKAPRVDKLRPVSWVLEDIKGVLHPDTKIGMFCLFSPTSRRKSILFM